MYQAKVLQLELRLDDMETRLLEANAHVSDSILERIEYVIDQHSVGGDGYGWPKIISEKLDQLIENLTSQSLLRLPVHDDNDECIAMDVDVDADGTNDTRPPDANGTGENTAADGATAAGQQKVRDVARTGKSTGKGAERLEQLAQALEERPWAPSEGSWALLASGSV